MTSLETLLAELGDALPLGAADAATGNGVGVTAIDLDLPVEVAVEADAALALSLPRGRLATGFDPHVGRLRVRYVREST